MKLSPAAIVLSLAVLWPIPFVDAAPGAEPSAEPKAAAPKMKQYIFGILRKGPKRDHDTEAAKRIQAGHMAHLEASAASGKLLVAGPFGDDGDWRGVLIYDVPTLEDARKICEADPAVVSGRLVCDLHPWWSMPGATLK